MKAVNDYDPEMMTVAADDGSRMSIFDQDWCPTCGANLIHDTDETRRYQAVICIAPSCDFAAVRDERPEVTQCATNR